MPGVGTRLADQRDPAVRSFDELSLFHEGMAVASDDRVDACGILRDQPVGLDSAVTQQHDDVGLFLRGENVHHPFGLRGEILTGAEVVAPLGGVGQSGGDQSEEGDLHPVGRRFDHVLGERRRGSVLEAKVGDDDREFRVPRRLEKDLLPEIEFMVSQGADIGSQGVESGHFRFSVKIEEKRAFVDVARLYKKDVSGVCRAQLFHQRCRLCESSCVFLGVYSPVDVVEREQRQPAVGGERRGNEQQESERRRKRFEYIPSCNHCRSLLVMSFPLPSRRRIRLDYSTKMFQRREKGGRRKLRPPFYEQVFQESSGVLFGGLRKCVICSKA